MLTKAKPRGAVERGSSCRLKPAAVAAGTTNVPFHNIGTDALNF
jgi:hypothetical protein